MVVILILPSTTSSTSGCDEFNYSNQRHKHQHRHRHTAHNDHHAQSRATNCRSQGGQPAKDACYVRHVTRINISDVYSQVEVDGDSEPVTKEGKSISTLHLISWIYIFYKVWLPEKCTQVHTIFKKKWTRIDLMNELNCEIVCCESERLQFAIHSRQHSWKGEKSVDESFAAISHAVLSCRERDRLLQYALMCTRVYRCICPEQKRHRLSPPEMIVHL